MGIGFKALQSDPYINIFYVMTTAKQGLATDDNLAVVFTLYVDDVLLAGGNKPTLEILKGKLINRFKKTWATCLVLGMQVTRKIQARSVVITQKYYIRGLLV